MNNFTPRFPCSAASAQWRNGPPQQPPTDLNGRQPATSFPFLQFYCGNNPHGAPPPGFGGSYYLHRIRQQNPVMISLPRVRHRPQNRNSYYAQGPSPSMMGPQFQQFRPGKSEHEVYMEALGLASQELYHNYYRLYLLNFHTFAGTFDNDGKGFFPLSHNDFLEKFNRRATTSTGEASTINETRSIGEILESLMAAHDPTWLPLQPDAFALSLNKLLHEAVLAHMNHIRQSECLRYMAHRNAPGTGAGDGWKAPGGPRMPHPNQSLPPRPGPSCVSAAETHCGCCECPQKYETLDRFQAEIVRHNECLERLEQLRIAALAKGIDFGPVYQPSTPADRDGLSTIHRPPEGFRDEFPPLTQPSRDQNTDGTSRWNRHFSPLLLPAKIQTIEGHSKTSSWQIASRSRPQTVQENLSNKHSSPLTSTPICKPSAGSCRLFSPLTYSPIDLNNESRSTPQFSPMPFSSEEVPCNMGFSKTTPTPVGHQSIDQRSYQTIPPIPSTVQTCEDPLFRHFPPLISSSREQSAVGNLSSFDMRLGPAHRQLRRSALLEDLDDIPEFEIVPLRNRLAVAEPSERIANRGTLDEARISSIAIPFAGFDEIEHVPFTKPQVPESIPFSGANNVETEPCSNISLSPISSGTCGSSEHTIAVIHSDISEEEPISWEYLSDGTPKPKPQPIPDLQDQEEAKSISPEPPVVEIEVANTETITPIVPPGFIDIQDDKVEFPPLEHLFVSSRKAPHSGRLRALKANRRGLKRLQSPRKQIAGVFRPSTYESPAPTIPSLLDLVLDNPEVPKKPSPASSPSPIPIPKDKVIQVNNWNTFRPSADPPEQEQETQSKLIKKNPFVIITPAEMREDKFTKDVNLIHIYPVEPVKPHIVISRKQIEFKIEDADASRELPHFSTGDSQSDCQSNDTTVPDNETESQTSKSILESESGIFDAEYERCIGSSPSNPRSPTPTSEEESQKLVIGTHHEFNSNLPGPSSRTNELEEENAKSFEGLPNEEKLKTAVWMKNKGKGKNKTEKNQKKRARNRLARASTNSIPDLTAQDQSSDAEASVHEEQTSTNLQTAQPLEARSAAPTSSNKGSIAAVHEVLPGVGITAASEVVVSSAIEPKNAQLLDRLINPNKVELLECNGKLRVKLTPCNPSQKPCELCVRRHNGNKSCEACYKPTTMFMKTNLPISAKYASIFSSKFLPRIGTVLVSDGSSGYMPGELTLTSVMKFILDLFAVQGAEYDFAYAKVTGFRDENFPSLVLDKLENIIKEIRRMVMDLNVEENKYNEAAITFTIVMAAFVLDIAQEAQRDPVPDPASSFKSRPRKNSDPRRKTVANKMAAQLKVQQQKLEAKLWKRFVIAVEAGKATLRSIIVPVRPRRHTSLLDLRRLALKTEPPKRRSLSASEATDCPPSKFPDFSTSSGTLTKAISTSDLVFPSPADLMLAYNSVRPEKVRTIF